jgi:sugar lactone lactonase YvrE
VSTEAICVVDSNNELGECPIWCQKEKVLWWIDVAKPGVWRYAPLTGKVDNWPLPKPPGAIALREAGGLFVALRRGFGIFDPESGALTPFEVPQLQLGDQRFNDGRVDRAGRLWIGTLDRSLKSPVGSLFRLGGDGRIQTMDRGFILSNGIGWSPDNASMYFAETHSQKIYQYEFDLASGAIGERRVFAEIDPGHGGPDGLCVDGDGNVWCVIFERGLINKYRPDGVLEMSLKLPIDRATSCTFGGEDLMTLYITSARIGLTEELQAKQPNTGGVWAVRLDRPGQPESCFAG